MPPYDSNQSRGKRLFCNTNTDRLGPKHLSNKAATRVKKKAAVAGSPEQIIIEDSDEVDVPDVETPILSLPFLRLTDSFLIHTASILT